MLHHRLWLLSRDGNTDLKDTLLGIGFGMGLQTKSNGLLKLAIANGSSKTKR
jgi:hypothetical protein